MRHSGFIDKGWGSELIWVTCDEYCCKFLNFKSGKKFSMHFHSKKKETWYVLSGKFSLVVVDTNIAEKTEHILNVGDVWTNLPLSPHQLTCIEEGTIIEVSTADSVEDNYRIERGDNQ